MNRSRKTKQTPPSPRHDSSSPAQDPPAAAAARRARLEALGAQAERIILARQDPHTGLLPASTAVTVHGDYTHAWVRDNVYSILAVWALAGAWREVDAARAAAYEERVTRLMRGLLAAMMRQAHKVERFKHTQNPLDALHAKYATHSGEPVVGDADWGHLQLDATALFLLMLAQMSTGGLAIVRDTAELAFVQNLVYYLGSAWRTPDYGIWERGHKRNEGVVELNASSLGMAKAALESIDGLAPLGEGAGRVQVPPDDIAHARHALEGLLPRESASKETDGALLSIVGYPAHAVDDGALAARTREGVRTRLEGRYGAKRFLRDGHQTVLEDHGRLHYEPGELARFEHIECEWPLFFCYQLIDAALRGDADGAADYRARLEALMVERDGERLLPELYIVPAEAVEAEKAAPRSQARVPNQNLPLVWAQSLYLVGVLLQEGLVAPRRIDPLGRHRRAAEAAALPPVQVQVALLASDELVRARLASHGLASECVAALQGRRVGASVLHVAAAEDAEPLWRHLGAEPALGLSGRPALRLGSWATSEILAWRDQRWVIAPALFNRRGSDLMLDNRLLVDEIEAELCELGSMRRASGQPLFVVMVSAPMLDAPGADTLLAYLRRLAAASPASGVADAAMEAGAQGSSETGTETSTGSEAAAAPGAATPATTPSPAPAPAPAPARRVGRLVDLLPDVATRTFDGTGPGPEGLLPIVATPPSTSASTVSPTMGASAATSGDLPWDEAATRPLAAVRAQALAADTDAPGCWQRLERSRNPYEQIALLQRLWQLAGPQATSPGVAPSAPGATADAGRHAAPAEAPPPRSVRERVEALHARAAVARHWGLLRRAAAVLDAGDDTLEDAAALLVTRQRRIVLGRGDGMRRIVHRPIGPADWQAALREGVGDDALERLLVQELLLLTSTLVKADAALFEGMLSLRPLELLRLMIERLAAEHAITAEAAFEHLLELSPQAVLGRLRETLADAQAAGTRLADEVIAAVEVQVSAMGAAAKAAPADESTGAPPWAAWRAAAGVAARLPAVLPMQLWQLLHQVDGVVIGAPGDPQHRLDPSLAQAEMTAEERSFVEHVDGLLDRIGVPAWRQLAIEALLVVCADAPPGAPPGESGEGYTVVIEHLLEQAARALAPVSSTQAPALCEVLAPVPPQQLARAVWQAWQAQRQPPVPVTVPLDGPLGEAIDAAHDREGHKDPRQRQEPQEPQEPHDLHGPQDPHPPHDPMAAPPQPEAAAVPQDVAPSEAQSQPA